jgi:hypothetical protein
MADSSVLLYLRPDVSLDAISDAFLDAGFTEDTPTSSSDYFKGPRDPGKGVRIFGTVLPSSGSASGAGGNQSWDHVVVHIEAVQSLPGTGTPPAEVEDLEPGLVERLRGLGEAGGQASTATRSPWTCTHGD